MKRFCNHPSLIKIKQLVNNQAKFSFQPVSVHTVKEVIAGLPSNKATAGEIPMKILKESGFAFEYLASCINGAVHPVNFQILLNCQIKCLSTRRKIRLIYVTIDQ